MVQRPVSSKSHPNLRLLSSTSKPIKFHRANHTEWADPEVDVPNLVAELTDNLNNYTTTKRDPNAEFIVFPDFPTSLRIMLDYYRSQVMYRPVGIQDATVVAIALGLPVIEAMSSIAELSSMMTEFQRHEKFGHPLETFAQDFFDLSFDVPHDTGKRFTVPMRPEYKARITRINMATGIKYCSIAIVSIYATLLQQPSLPSAYFESWESSLETMRAMVDAKLKMGRELVSILKRTVYGEE